MGASLAAQCVHTYSRDPASWLRREEREIITYSIKCCIVPTGNHWPARTLSTAPLFCTRRFCTRRFCTRRFCTRLFLVALSLVCSTFPQHVAQQPPHSPVSSVCLPAKRFFQVGNSFLHTSRDAHCDECRRHFRRSPK